MTRTHCRPAVDVTARRRAFYDGPIAAAGTFTPGDVTGPARPWAAGTPYANTLNTHAGNPIHTPIVGVLVAGAVLLLLERRRLGLRRL